MRLWSEQCQLTGRGGGVPDLSSLSLDDSHLLADHLCRNFLLLLSKKLITICSLSNLKFNLTYLDDILMILACAHSYCKINAVFVLLSWALCHPHQDNLAWISNNKFLNKKITLRKQLNIPIFHLLGMQDVILWNEPPTWPMLIPNKIRWICHKEELNTVWFLK